MNFARTGWGTATHEAVPWSPHQPICNQPKSINKPYCDIRIWKNIKYEYVVNQTEGRRPFLPAISGDIGYVDNYLVYRMYPHYVYLETHVSKISGAFPTYKKIRRKSTRMAQCRKHGAIPQKRRNGNSARARTAQSRAKTVQSLAKTAHSNTKI